MKATDSLQIIQNLIPYLIEHPVVSYEEIAAEFDLPVNKVDKLLQALNCTESAVEADLGNPEWGFLATLDFDSDEGVVYECSSEYLKRFPRLNRGEANSLLAALQVLGAIEQLEWRDAALSAAAQLSEALAAESALAVDKPAEEKTGLLEQLQKAIEQRHRLVLDYAAESSKQASRPTVDPADIFSIDDKLYLVAYSLDRSDWRHYRLDRIMQVDEAGEAVPHEAAPAQPAGWKESFESDQKAKEVTLKVRGTAAFIADDLPVTSRKDLPDGSVEFGFLLVNPNWLAGLVLKLGSALISIDPPELVKPAVELAQQTLACYQELAND